MRQGEKNIALAIFCCPVLDQRLGLRPVALGEQAPALAEAGHTRGVGGVCRLGEPKHPAWYLNLRDNPRVSVQVGAQTRQMLAVTATGEERARLWTTIIATAPNFADYEKKTTLAIPVVILTDAAE